MQIGLDEAAHSNTYAHRMTGPQNGDDFCLFRRGAITDADKTLLIPLRRGEQPDWWPVTSRLRHHLMPGGNSGPRLGRHR